MLQVFVLLFIFVKRQIMRFAMKSRRGPHVPIGHNAPKVTHICALCIHCQCRILIFSHSCFVIKSLVNVVCDAHTVFSNMLLFLCVGAAGAETRNWSQTVQSPENPLWASSAVPRRWSAEAGRTAWLEGLTHTLTHIRQSCKLLNVHAILWRNLRVCVAGAYDYLYRMRALDAIRDTGTLCCHWPNLVSHVMTDYESFLMFKSPPVHP